MAALPLTVVIPRAMSPVTTESHEGVAVVRMDDGKANAINGALLDGLDAAMDDAGAAGAPVVLVGRTGFFSGGLDLKTLPTLPPDALSSVLHQFGKTMMRLFRYRRPMVAACTGHALAGGMVTLLAADERYGVDGPFKLGLNETQIGMTLPRFVVEMARAQLPAHSMREVVIQGGVLNPERALELSLLDGLQARDEVVAHAIRRARQLATLPASAYGDNKLGVRGPFADAGEAAYTGEMDEFMSSFAAAAKAR